MSRLSAYVEGVAILGPGFDDWPAAVAILSGAAPYLSRPTVLPLPASLPPAERRRTGRVIKLALAVGLEAVARAGTEAASLATVFTSSGGDGHNCHDICRTLASADRQLSPTRFHNSVHNAAAGYWAIATGAKEPANVLCAFDASFGAGLLEALTQVAIGAAPVLLLAYDTEYPHPLHEKRPIPDAFATALVLSPAAGTQSSAKLTAALTEAPAERMNEAALEALRTAIPAARSLPLLARLARREAGRVVIDYLDGTRIALEVEPCR